MIVFLCLTLVLGFVCGFHARQPKVRHVYDSESETLTRVQAHLDSSIKRREAQLLGDRCGWAEGDRLRERNRHDREILKVLGVEYPGDVY